jgi:hypothetical protein
MTIKTQVVGGETRIITKVVDGSTRVSCECCEEGLTCCVYPATCDKGPESILFYGTTLTRSGFVSYGNTTNGVIREPPVWAVYRNGVRSTLPCLSMSYEEFTFDVLPSTVGANLADSYLLTVGDFLGEFEFVLTFAGASSGSPEMPWAAGQCRWDANAQPVLDDGMTLIFSPDACRWEIVSGPLAALYGYRDDDSPVGAYFSDFFDPLTVS